jgi:hypothetical protein
MVQQVRKILISQKIVPVRLRNENEVISLTKEKSKLYYLRTLLYGLDKIE